MTQEPTIKAVREACGHASDATSEGMPSLIFRTAVGDAVRRLGVGDAPAPKSPEAVIESAIVGRAWADGQSVWMCVFDIALKRWARALPIADTAQAAEAYRARVRAEALREAVGLRGVAPRSRGRRARWAVTPMTPEHARAIVADAIASSDDGTLSGPDLLRAAPVLIAEFDRLIAASAAVVAAWDDDEIGRVDGALIDALRGAR